MAGGGYGGGYVKESVGVVVLFRRHVYSSCISKYMYLFTRKAGGLGYTY